MLSDSEKLKIKGETKGHQANTNKKAAPRTVSIRQDLIHEDKDRIPL